MNVDDICWIVGIVDSYGDVRSVVLEYDNPRIADPHATFFSSGKRWRWAESDGVFFDVPGREPDEFEQDEVLAIHSHLERIGIGVISTLDVTNTEGS